ncbi:flippase-like domain-containing protein [Candidatus Woesearchaeota archaeon]|nr:flippase-like domain-containing protein [Candidatus Woesearchaeota archaeon]
MKFKIPLLKNILLLAVGIIIFYLIFQMMDTGTLVEIFSDLNLFYAVLLFMMSAFINFVLMADKWRRIVTIVGTKISLLESAYIHIANFPLVTLLPARAGEFFKVYYMKKKFGLGLKEGAGTVIFDKATDLSVMVFFILFGLVFLDIKLPISIHYIFIAMAVMAPVGFIVLSKMKYKIFTAFSRMGLSRTVFFLAYSLINWTIGLLSFKVLFLTLNINIPFGAIFTLSPIITLISTLPVTLSGFGTREAAVVFFFSKYATPEQLFASGILMSIMEFVIPSLLGLIFFKKFYGDMIKW